MSRNAVFVLSLGLLMLGCANMQRSSGSGYAGKNDSGVDTAAASAAAELGIPAGTELSADQMQILEERQQVRRLEGKLGSTREKEQYSKVLPWLKNDREKIDYLSIESMEGRNAWVNSKDIWKRSKTVDGLTKEIMDSGDIAVGMVADNVRKTWGEPAAVEVSGNPLYRNERWKYVRFVSSTEGYRQERRFVYFEGGRVVGWETE